MKPPVRQLLIVGIASFLGHGLSILVSIELNISWCLTRKSKDVYDFQLGSWRTSVLQVSIEASIKDLIILLTIFAAEEVPENTFKRAKNTSVPALVQRYQNV